MIQELRSIIETVKNQVVERESGCLSMRSERLLVAEIERLTSVLELISTLKTSHA